jgi:hypothetical protein
MSSVPALALAEKEQIETLPVWGEEGREPEITAEIEDIEHGYLIGSPIFVDGEKLEIESSILDVGRVYEFEYLGTKMVLWKLRNGAVDLFELIEE